MNHMNLHPDVRVLLNYRSEDDIVTFHQNEAITYARLLAEVEYLDKLLPSHVHLLNLYEERYYFLLGLLLGLIRNSIHLFPTDKTLTTFKSLKVQYPQILVLYNKPIGDPELKLFDLQAALSNIGDARETVATNTLFGESRLNEENIVLFTSGSTGQPEPYKKKWTDFIQMSAALGKKLNLENNPSILSTVPAQHMYGFEVSIMLPLVNGLSIISERPFYPADMVQILEKHTHNTILVSTPIHYRACIKSSTHLPYLQQAISSTAPIDSSLAGKFEQQQNTSLIEIYGCTEVGVIAVRQTSKVRHWTCLEGIQIHNNAENSYLTTTRSVKHFILNDSVTVIDKNQFILQGKKDDLINIAGKRNSLANLNYHLQNINLLDDGCFYQIPKSEDYYQRLVIFVVCSNIATKDKDNFRQYILKSLKVSIDELFLPKEIYLIDKLPRKDTGKIPLAALDLLYQKVRNSQS